MAFYTPANAGRVPHHPLNLVVGAPSGIKSGSFRNIDEAGEYVVAIRGVHPSDGTFQAGRDVTMEIIAKFIEVLDVTEENDRNSLIEFDLTGAIKAARVCGR